MVSSPENDSISETAEKAPHTSSVTESSNLFWVIFIFMAVQTLLALIINFSRNTSLFYLQPALSIIFCAITARIVVATMTSAISKVVSIFLLIAAYLLATVFFFITAIFVGGLPG